MLTRVAVREALSPKRKRYQISPKLKEPESMIPQAKIDNVNAGYLSLANQKQTTLPAEVGKSSVLCLDLENNKGTAHIAGKIGKKVSCLNLSFNVGLDVRLGMLKRLRSLFMDSCKLKSLVGLPTFPNLRCLSVANNDLENLGGLSLFTKLESIDLRGNCVDFPSKLAIAAVGSVFLHEFNGEELTEEQMRESFEMSPLVGVSLRLGRDMESHGTPEDEVDASQEFLTRDIRKFTGADNNEEEDINQFRLTVAEYENELCIMCPLKAQEIKWYRSISRRGLEWEELKDDWDAARKCDKKNSERDIIHVTMMMRMHLVKCEFNLDGKRYALFTDWPVDRKEGELCMPYPVDAIIAGLPIEGALVSSMPTERIGRIAWAREGCTLAEGVPSIRLTNADVGKVVVCLLQPHCPRFPSIVFATVFCETGEIEPQTPTVSDVTFPDYLIQGEKITFARRMIPDCEGESQIQIERAKSPSGEWSFVTALDKNALEYTPTKDDLGRYLRLGYMPVTTAGSRGETAYFYSMVAVSPALPVFRNAVIAGLPKTHRPLIALADYSGGEFRECACNWFFSMTPITGNNIKSLDTVATNTVRFTPDEDCAGGFLAVEMVPVRFDGVTGDPVYAALREPIVLDVAPEPFESVPKRAVVGEKIAMGQEVSFFLSDTKEFCGFREVKRGTTFKPLQAHVGRFLRIVSGTSDCIVGCVEAAPPVITKITIDCESCEVGDTAVVSFDGKHVVLDRMEVLWIRCQRTCEWVVAVDVAEYTIHKDDAGSRLKVRVTLLDSLGRVVSFTESTRTAVVNPKVAAAPVILRNRQDAIIEGEMLQLGYDKPATDIKWLRSDPKLNWVECECGSEDASEYYRLKVSDIGCYIRCQFKVGGSVLAATTIDTVRPQDEAIIMSNDMPIPCEGNVLDPKIDLFVGKRGKHGFEWFVTDSESGDQSSQLPSSCMVSNDKTYEVKSSDIGKRILLQVTRYHMHKAHGLAKTYDYGIVIPALPSVKNVAVKQNEEGLIECCGSYFGGVEGSSVFWWRAVAPDGKIVDIGRTKKSTFSPPPQLTGYEIEATYEPVRDDDARGTPVASSSKDRVVVRALPVLEKCEILSQNGAVVTGSALRCRASGSSDCATFEYQWYRGTANSLGNPIDGATKMDYTPTSAEVGMVIHCGVTGVSRQGWHGKQKITSAAAAVETDMSQLIIQARRNKYQNGVSLTTNYQTEVMWERRNGEEWVSVGFEQQYVLTANDVGYVIRATFNDVVSKPTPVIELDAAIAPYVNATVRAKTLVFDGSTRVGATKWKISISGGNVVMKTRNIEKTAKLADVTIECVPDTKNEIVIMLSASTRFDLIASIANPKNHRVATIPEEHARDYIVAVVMGLKKI